MAKNRIREYSDEMSNDEKYWYVFETAKSLGDKFPEVTAAQYVVESGYGTSNLATNQKNYFGQTAKGDTLSKRKFMDFKHIDDAIAYRVKKWSPKYAHAKDPISAMAAIQPAYAPSSDGNDNYMSSVAAQLKSYGFFNGDPSRIPNADKNPDFYKGTRMMNAQKDYSFSKEYVRDNYNSYNKEIAALKENKQKDPEGLVAEKMKNIQIKYQKMGLIPFFNTEIIRENEEAKKKFNNSDRGLKEMYEWLNDPSFINTSNVSDNGIHNVIFDPEKDAKFQAALKANPELKKYITKVKKKNDSEFEQDIQKYHPNAVEFHIPQKNNGNNVLDFFQKKVQAITGNKGYTLYDKNGQLTRTSGMGLWKTQGVLNDNLLDDTKLNIPEYGKPLFDANVQGKPLLQEIPIPDETPKEKPAVPEVKLSTTDPYKYTDDDIKQIQAATVAKKTIEENKTANLDALYANKLEGPTVAGKEEFKKEIPFLDIVSSAAGIFEGMEMANRKTPMRDEQVSGAYMNYAAELSKLSRIGLRPEEEAAAKANLAESYQISMDAVANMANGNRNIVLGNLGRVDAQHQQGILQISLADAAAKNEALDKYGAAMQYVNEFDARRDIENNTRKYNEAIRTKEAGAGLAGAAFGNLIDSLTAYNENKPGSANQMYRSNIYRNLFEVDPQLKDDGTGNTPYTLSWKNKRDKGLLDEANAANAIADKYHQLPMDKKIMANEFAKENNHVPNISAFVDYLHGNEVYDPMDLKNMSKATATNDYSQIFGGNQKIDRKKVDSVLSEIQNNPGKSFDEVNQQPENSYDFLYNANTFS